MATVMVSEELSEDEDVVLANSPLHEHLVKEGFVEAHETTSSSPKEKSQSSLLSSRRRDQAPVWPTNTTLVELQVDVAQRVLSSDLLIHEDEYFVSNFILTEENLMAIEDANWRDKNSNRFSSVLGDVLFYSGSMALAASSVLYLSEKCQMAAAVAAVMPPAMAAFYMGSWNNAEVDEATKQKQLFNDLVDEMLKDMKVFKQLVRKSLNLIQGMELMHSGFTLAVNSSTGGASPSKTFVSSSDLVMSERECLSSLRRSTYQSLVRLIRKYREAVGKLMEVSPLADHVDFKEHYIAFIEMEKFGICESVDEGKMISVKELRDVVQISLVQQSEYLRRFVLAFSDKVRERNSLNKTGLLDHVKKLVITLQNINEKLAKVLEYHQALGIVSEEKHPTALFEKKKDKIGLLPLRSVYTSLFTTGLHLQKSLLKVRDLEKAFDAIEKKRTNKHVDVMELMLTPEDNPLLDWMKGFELIQNELNACVGCLNEGMAQIDVLQLKDSHRELTSKSSQVNGAEEDGDADEDEMLPKEIVIDCADTEPEYMDEVFEGYKDGKNQSSEHCEFPEMTEDDRKMLNLQKIQSEKLLKELRSVLVEKADETKKREEIALNRKKQSTVPFNDPFLLKCPSNGHVQKDDCDGFEDSFNIPEQCFNNDNLSLDARASASRRRSSSSSSSETMTVKSKSTESKKQIRGAANHQRNSSSSSYSSAAASDKSEVEDFETDGGKNDLKQAPSLDTLPNEIRSSGSISSITSPLSKEMRSLSSPDIRRLLSEESSSPYISLERLADASGDNTINASNHSNLSEESDDDGNGSADEMQIQKLKTFKKPLRPAAFKNGGRPMSRRDKRARNTTLRMSGPPSTSASSYLLKHEKEDLFVPSRAMGFESSIAIQAANRALNGINGQIPWQKKEEEVFGSD